MHPTDSSRPWLRELRSRFAAHRALKAVAIPLFLAGFFAAYFQLLRHPVFPVTTMPTLAFDRFIAFSPLAAVPYLSLWIYVVLGAGTVQGAREIRLYCFGVLALTAVGLGTFLFWPTTTPAAGIDWSHYRLMRSLKTIDASGNACTSLHVAFAVFTAIWIERLLRQLRAPVWPRVVNATWAAAIAYGTLATKQHLTVDLLAGAALGGVVGWLDPAPPGSEFRPTPCRPGRLWLALAIAAATKATILALGPQSFSPGAVLGLFLLLDLWIFAGLLVPNFRSLIPTATRFATTEREVWLTIDDGPEASTTRPMLDLLARYDAKATFFVIGLKAAQHPELLNEIRRRGHTVGNHTQTHPLATFWLAGPGRTAREIDDCDAILARDGASLSDWFRAPAGVKTFFLRQVLVHRNRVLIGWSGRARENFRASRAAPLRRLTRAVRPGAILLLHEGAAYADQRVTLLAALLEHLSAHGYRCVLPRRESLR